ncbi:MAG: hypothetical protein JWN48_1873 [Myxococcaceae bacterium]|nr:hypothetical protein [Myxococcaceae bacterium]
MARTDSRLAVVRYTLFLLDGRMLILQFIIGREALLPGDIRTHGFETFGIVLQRPAGAAQDAPLETLGYVSRATLHFSQGRPNKGDPVVGSFEGVFTKFDGSL